MQTISTALRNAINAGNPQRVLLVFGTDELTNEDIVMSNGLELREEFNSDEDLTIGQTPSSVITFTLLNDEDQLEDFSFGWFTAYLGARISGTTTELTRQYVENGSTVTYAFVPLGTFYASKPKIIKKKTISITAYDRMAALDIDMPSNTELNISYPSTLGVVFQNICQAVSVTPKTTTFLNSDLVVTQAPEDFANATVRQVIGWIAECACSIARFSRDGQLEFAWFTTTNAEYDENDYKEFSPAWYETAAINGLYCRDTELSTEQTEGVTKTNNYLIQDNPFLRG